MSRRAILPPAMGIHAQQLLRILARLKGSSWLLSVVRHRAIDVTCGKGYSTPGSRRWKSWWCIPGQEDVWPEVSRNIDADTLRQAMDTLPEVQKRAIAMACFEGYTDREIAETISVPLGTVKGRIRLGMNRLREVVIPQVRSQGEQFD